MNGSKHNFDKTITLEFYINEDEKLAVKYNNTPYEFTIFWTQVSNAREICKTIYQEIKTQYPLYFNNIHTEKQDWKETFLRFINKHLIYYDKFLDVVIKQGGQITIRLER